MSSTDAQMRGEKELVSIYLKAFSLLIVTCQGILKQFLRKTAIDLNYFC